MRRDPELERDVTEGRFEAGTPADLRQQSSLYGVCKTCVFSESATVTNVETHNYLDFEYLNTRCFLFGDMQFPSGLTASGMSPIIPPPNPAT